MPDAIDIKESLGAKLIKAPAPSTAATKEERLAEAQKHIAAAGLARGHDGWIMHRHRTIKDPKYGHEVEVHELPSSAPGLGNSKAAPTAKPVAGTVAGGPKVTSHELAKKDAPGNIRVKEDLVTQHNPANKKG
jgi:hypothetical protein